MKRKQWTQELIKQKRIQDQKKIANYRELVKDLLNLKDAKSYTSNSLTKTTVLLRINPEFNAIWNYRRDIISDIANKLDAEFWNNELLFTLALLKQYPKVYWIWNHRLWTLEHQQDSSVDVWKIELGMASKLLQMDARNFHGWHYRRIIIDRIEKLTGHSMDEEELEFATENINKNISNFSAWHQRAVLIPRMFANDEISDKKTFVENEFAYITHAMFTDAEDQSVWFYIKWFIKNDLVSKTLGNDEYIRLLQELKNNILIINQDDLDFSGKQNNWCLKILIALEDVQKALGIEIEAHSNEYLKQLIEADPLRKNRYLHLINTE